MIYFMYYIGGPKDMHKEALSKVPPPRIKVHEAIPCRPHDWLDGEATATAECKTHEYHVREAARNVFIAVHLELLW